MGGSSVRNLGIKKAQGDYILFVDGDNFWSDAEFLSGLAKKLITELDVVIFPYSLHGKRLISLSYQVPDGITLDLDYWVEELVTRGMFFTSAWNKCVKRSCFLNTSNLLFPLNFLSEDVIWCANLLKVADTALVYNNNQYMYRQNRIGSITNTVKLKNVLDILRSIDTILTTDEDSENRYPALLLYATIAYVSILPYVEPYLKDIEIAHYLNKYHYLLRYSSRLKGLSFKLTGLGSLFLGLSLSTKLYHSLLGLYKRFRA